MFVNLALGGGNPASANVANDRAGQQAGSYLPDLTRQPKEDLLLEIYLNGYRTNIVSTFHRYGDGCLVIDRDGLEQFHLKTPDLAAHGSGGGFCLEKLPGVTYRYDQLSQSIYLNVTDEARIPLEFDARGRRPDTVTPARDLSAVVNYTLFANWQTDNFPAFPNYQGASASIDAHLFSSYGVMDQSFVAAAPMGAGGWDVQPNVLRLDTRYSYDNPDALTTYAAGDIISGSLNWTRSIRMGGVQVRRDFALRPDLVTMPLPQLAASAAVPSTVELYVNQSRVLSQEIAGGPFSIANAPLVSGPGTIRLALRDASGKETVSEYAYYASPLLLAPGLYDYSVEAGFARTFYGLDSNSYDGNPIASGSVRYGLTPFLTAEAHAEGGAGLINGGAGVDVDFWHYGIISLAMSGGAVGGQSGEQIAASLDTALWGARIFARTLRGFGNYADLASVTAPNVGSRLAGLSGAPYLRQDQISLSFPLGFDSGAVGFSYVGAEDYAHNGYKMGSASYSRPFIWDKSTFSINAFNDFEGKAGYGAFAGVTVSTGDITTSLTAQTSKGSYSAGPAVSKSAGQEPGSFGYSVLAQAGSSSPTSYGGSLTYRGSAMQVTAGAQQSGDSAQFMALAQGSLAFMDGVYFANRIDNSFAVVDAGIPNLQILRDNQPVGETDSDGRLLVPSLVSRAQNSIRVDPASVPVQAELEDTEQKVVPVQRGGVSVHFKGVVSPPSAVVVFRDSKGAFIPASSEAWVNGGQTPFSIGYDGEAYLTGLAASNTVLIKIPDGTPCNASFDFTSKPNGQARIDNVVCQ